MRQDYFVFRDVLSDTLAYLFRFDLMGWWSSLAEQGTDKFWMAGIVILLVLFFVAGYFHWTGRFVSFCLLGAYLGVILAAGESPSVATVTVAVLYVTSAMAAGNGRNNRMAAGSALAMLALSGIFLFVSHWAGVPILKDAFGDVMPLRTKIQQTSLVHVLNDLLPEELKFQDGTGEYEGGSLETQDDGPDFSGRTVVSVEIDELPERPIYWVRYTGNKYTGYSFNGAGDLDDPKNPANIRYPSDVLSNLEGFVKENSLEDPWEIKDFIVNTLGERTCYNLHVNALPQGKDFIEYFFFESREGYCIHYAATAVMMFRMYGIPARYVTGFLIPPSMFYKNESGIYQADVPDDHAHAWVEAYIDGRWVTVEATPSDGVPISVEKETKSPANGADGGLEIPETEAAMAAEEQSLLKENQEISSTSQSENGGGKIQPVNPLEQDQGAPSWIFLPVVFVLAVVLIAAGLIIRRFLILEKRKKEDIQEIFADIHEVMVQNGLPLDITILSEELPDKMLAKFPWLNRAETEQVLDIVLRTTYGPDKGTREEREKVHELYLKLCTQLGRNQKGMGKITFYLVDAWI